MLRGMEGMPDAPPELAVAQQSAPAERADALEGEPPLNPDEPVFAQRGATSKSAVLMGVQPEAYSRIVKMDGYMTQGRFAVQGTETLIGTELAKDLGVTMSNANEVVNVFRRAFKRYPRGA